MNTNPLKQGALTEDSAGIGTATRKMVQQRAVEWAIINGWTGREVSPSDWEQAKLEATGNSDLGSNEALLESAPESEHWDPVPGSAGGNAPVAPGEDEDAEGRSDNEGMFDEGMAEAEQDQTHQAGSK
jgi:hypothetical protein